jgi:hypothetical protein
MSLALMADTINPGSRRYALRKLREAVKRLVKAEIDDSWKGGGDPDDIPGIERELELARGNYKRRLGDVERLIK